METKKIKKDPQAEAVIEALAEIRPDMKRKDIEFIFNLGATYAASKAQAKLDKIREMLSAFNSTRADRVVDIGRRP